jgi:hypothetical protein
LLAPALLTRINPSSDVVVLGQDATEVTAHLHKMYVIAEAETIDTPSAIRWDVFEFRPIPQIDPIGDLRRLSMAQGSRDDRNHAGCGSNDRDKPTMGH